MPQINKSLVLIISAFFAIYVIWGSTYLFTAFAMDELPPFYTAGSRYFMAGVLLLFITFLLGKLQSISRVQWKNSIFAGILMLGLGGGCVFWSLQYVDTGFTALVISGQPLLILFLMWALDGKKPTNQAYLGIVLGIIGIYLLISQKTLITGPDQWKGVVAIFISMISWGYGSLFIAKADLPKPQLANSSIQMIMGGGALLIVSAFVEQPFDINIFQLSTTTYSAMLYLIFFGSIIAFSAFNYLLTKVSPEKVATSTYVNPVVALFLGWFFRNELITNQSILAACIMLTGVFFINTKPEFTQKIKGNLLKAVSRK